MNCIANGGTPMALPTTMKNILVLNGPNLNMLGIREPNIYGKQDYPTLVAFIQEAAAKLGLTVDVRQSNHPGAEVMPGVLNPTNPR